MSTSRQIVFLVGYMGSGKTTLGRKLANKLGWDFIDLDELLVAQFGTSIETYFKYMGEEAFRLEERDALRTLNLERPTVVSTGGGTPCFHDNMAWMNSQGLTVYLNLSPQALCSRLMKTDLRTRPLLQGHTETSLLAHISEKLIERTAFYELAVIHFYPYKQRIQDLLDEINQHTRTYDRDTQRSRTPGGF